MKFPNKIHDPELGDVEWIFPTTSEEEVTRINRAVQKKIDIIEGKKTDTALEQEWARLEAQRSEFDKQLEEFEALIDEQA